MAALKIALLGASRTQLSELAAALDEALKASGWQALLVVADDAATLPADLASFGLVLLAGLQSPASSLFLDSRASALEPAQEAADQSIRAALAHGALAYRVLYGTPDERLAHALHAVQSLLPAGPNTPEPESRIRQHQKPALGLDVRQMQRPAVRAQAVDGPAGAALDWQVRGKYGKQAIRIVYKLLIFLETFLMSIP